MPPRSVNPGYGPGSCWCRLLPCCPVSKMHLLLTCNAIINNAYIVNALLEVRTN